MSVERANQRDDQQREETIETRMGQPGRRHLPCCGEKETPPVALRPGDAHPWPQIGYSLT
jgi:hypothetical protein